MDRFIHLLSKFSRGKDISMNKKNTTLLYLKPVLLVILSLVGLKLEAQSTLSAPDILFCDTIVTSKFKVSVGGQMRLNGFYDFNALQNSEAFNITNIPTGNSNSSPRFALSVRQSRISLDAGYNSEKLGKIYTFFEGDFLGDGPLDFRLRHFWIDIKSFRIGQDWSAFCDMNVWPDIIDFDGPPTGAWARSAQIKYTKNISNFGHLAIALESPRASITEVPIVDSTLTATFQGAPDLTGHIHHKAKWGHIQLAFVLRRLHFLANDKTLANNAGGLSLSGNFNLGKRDNFMYQLNGGSGIGSYLVSFEGGGYDAVTKGNGELSNIQSLGGYCAYEKWWNQYLKSTFVYGYMHLNTDIGFTIDQTFNGHYSSANLFWLLDENITMGLEGQYGTVNDFSKQSGDATRIQLMLLLNF